MKKKTSYFYIICSDAHLKLVIVCLSTANFTLLK